MPEVKEVNGKKYWKNAEGEWIPIKRVFPYEKRADRLVERVHAKVEKLQKLIASEKGAIAHLISDYLELVAKENNTSDVDDCNTTIYNFDKSRQIEVKISKHFIADERLNIAKKKIDKCIERWSNGVNDNIIALVNKAFKVDNTGNVDVKQLKGLKELNIKDKEWKEAIALIEDSIKVDVTKTYFNFRSRDESGKLSSIPLNFSAL